MARKLVVEIIGDASSLERSYAKASKATGKFGKEVERAGRGATVATVGFRGLGRSVAFASGSFLAGAGFVAAVKTSIEAASNLNEQMSKSNVVFGKSAAAVEDWSKTTVTSMGLAQDQALETASSFGALLRPIGLTGDAAAQQAERLTKLGADLASFYNTSVADALQAIRSGLVGEVEPLRRYGVLLSETRVQQEALNETGKKTASALTPQEKVLARLKIIYGDTAQAQGDFIRTSGGFANQMRILQANVRQLEIELGQALLPALLNIVTAINTKVVPAIEAMRGALNRLRKASGGPKDSPTTGFSQALRLLIDPGFGLGKAIEGVDRLGQAFGIVKKNAENAGVAVGAFVHDMTTGLGVLGATRSPLLGQQPDPFARKRRVDPFADVRPGRVGAIKGVSVEQRNRIFDARIARLLDRVQDIKGLRDQIAQLKVIRDLIEARVAVTKDVTRKLNLGDQIAQINRDILGDQAQIADDAKKAADKLRAKEEAARKAEKAAAAASLKRATERVAAINKAAVAQVAALKAFSDRVKAQQRAREQAKVFGLIGLSATGGERAPSQGNLQAALKKAQEVIAGTPVDTKAMQSRLARLRDVINTEFNKLNRDTRIKVKEFLDALTGKDSDHPLTKGGAVGGRNLALMLSSGLHLNPAEFRRFETNLNAQKLSATGPIHVHTHIDGREIGLASTRAQQRDRYRTARQTSGFRG